MKRQVFWSIFLTLLFVYIATPIYSNNLKEFVLLNYKNKEVRVDIFNYGQKDNKVTVIDATYLENTDTPQYLRTANGQGTFVKMYASRKWKNFHIKAKANKKGSVKILLKGPYILANDTLVPVLLDYKNLTINDKKIFSNREMPWFSAPYIKEIKVNDGEIIDIKFTARRHKIKLKDLSRYTSFSWLMLITTITLSFLLSYQLVKYLSKFKIEKNHSRIDIVFLAVFFALLFMPMSNISDAEKSVKENRMLAKKPQLKDVLASKGNYGANFEKWFNDRFWGRDAIISLNDILRKISYLKKNNFAIMNNDEMIFNLESLSRLVTPIKKEDLIAISKNIELLHDFCRKNNIKLYILIPPSKEDLFADSIGIYNRNHLEKSSLIKSIVQYVKEHNSFDILYPRDIYLKKHDELTHFKTDHHWTEFGAFLGYQELIKEIKKDFPNINILQEEDYKIFYKDRPRYGSFINMLDRPFYHGSDCDRLGVKIENCPLNYLYKYYDHKNMKKLTVEFGPINMSRVTYYKKGINKKAVLLGNSYGGFLMPFLPYNFNSLLMIRVNNEEKGVQNVYDMKRFEKIILDFDADILIFYLASSYVYDFKKLYPSKD